MIEPPSSTSSVDTTPQRVPGRIFLIGYRGSGKTSVAQSLANRLRCRTIDTDAAIVERIGMSIADFFRRSGEDEFRQVESDVIQQVCRDPSPVIVSLGGGAILRETNRRWIRTGWTVWLDADETELTQRLQRDTATASQRPSLTAAASAIDEIAAVMVVRRPIYSELCDLRIDTTHRSLDEICDEIVGEFEKSSLCSNGE